MFAPAGGHPPAFHVSAVMSDSTDSLMKVRCLRGKVIPFPSCRRCTARADRATSGSSSLLLRLPPPRHWRRRSDRDGFGIGRRRKNVVGRPRGWWGRRGIACFLLSCGRFGKVPGDHLRSVYPIIPEKVEEDFQEPDFPLNRESSPAEKATRPYNDHGKSAQ